MRHLAILVVDDEKNIRRTLRVCLESMNAEVTEASSTAAALEASRHAVFDVVFLDLQLGGERGEVLLDELRGRVPVAVVTGSADPTVDGPDADAVLAKPFAPAELAATVRRLSP